MEIIKIPNKLLAQKLQTIPVEDIAAGKYQKLIEQMQKNMIAANGVGLAANQVGQDLALFVIDKRLADESKIPSAFLNPEITEQSKEQDEMEEGCLSIPEYYVAIRRSKKIMFKAITPEGKKFKLKARGFLARVLQHETDHLNGLTIKNRIKK